MRFLKKKIALRKADPEDQVDLRKLSDDFQVKEEDNSEDSFIRKIEDNLPVTESALPLRGPRKTHTPPTADSKNIVKNYGKALCSFASSKLALPYIESLVSKKGYEAVNIKKFMEDIKQKKESTNSMESLRRLLMENSDDNEETRECKRLFKEVSIIFMKYFSVNWIFNGKLVHKHAHLKFRFKMLRRIQNPQHFTYLKTSAKNS
jgi:hypothetical protein